MEVVFVDSEAAIGELVASAIVDLLTAQPDATLGLATGSSPLPVYAALVERHRRRDVTFAEASAFLLDEYVGLGAEHPQSYRRFIVEHLQARVDLPDQQLFGPDGLADDLLGECERYERRIQAAGGIDLQILGIGVDGHIGFNEPSSSLGSRTRLKTLTTQTRADNARFFDDAGDVPLHVITQGLGTILEARHLVLVATGEHKAAPVAAAVEGPVTAFCPASVLQLHRHATIIVDAAAGSELRLADYYRETYAAKPRWQGL